MWFLRVVEQVNGQWVCRHGLTEFDAHTSLHQAVAHLRVLAREYQPAQLFLHRLDGSVEQL